jgi:hypothetical protein
MPPMVDESSETNCADHPHDQFRAQSGETGVEVGAILGAARVKKFAGDTGIPASFQLTRQ